MATSATRKTGRSGAATAREVVCPFCSLLCDDLEIRAESGTLRVANTRCPRALRGFTRADRPMAPHVGGEPVSLDEAVARAAAILRAADQPLISGMAADVAGCRAAVALAEACGAAVDHVHGAAAMQNLRVLQARGWITTTLAELKNRADLLLLVGTSAVESHPRFFERLVWNQDSLSGLRRNRRRVIYLGDPASTAAGTGPGGVRPGVIRCQRAELPEMLGALRAVLRGTAPQPGRLLSARRIAALDRLAGELRRARYGVVVWAPAELGPEHADLCVRALSEMVVELNTVTRFAGLSLSGNDGGASCQSVLSWQSGFPLRVNFASGTPEFDPVLNGTEYMLGHAAADAMLWLNSMNPELRPPACRAPLIAVARPSRRLALEAEVFLPVSTPGVDHAGAMFRTDSVVSLPLRALRQSANPPAATVLDAVRALL